MRCDCKRQSQIHATAVTLDRRVDEFLYLRKSHDLVESAFDFVSAHAEDRSVEINIFAAGQFGVKTSAYFQQAADATAQLNPARAGFGDSRQNPEQRSLAGAVAANNAYDFSRPDFKAGVA